MLTNIRIRRIHSRIVLWDCFKRNASTLGWLANQDARGESVPTPSASDRQSLLVASGSHSVKVTLAAVSHACPTRSSQTIEPSLQRTTTWQAARSARGTLALARRSLTFFDRPRSRAGRIRSPARHGRISYGPSGPATTTCPIGGAPSGA